MPLPNPAFSVEERSLLRAAFLRLIPISDEVAAHLYAPWGITSAEKFEEAIRHLATIMDAMTEPETLATAFWASREWHRNQGISANELDSFGLTMTAALGNASEPPAPREGELWIRLWAALGSPE